MSEKRLVEIETKIAFHEKTIKDLNDVVYEQHKEIERLGAICDTLIKRLKEVTDLMPEIDTPTEEKPPHY